MSRFAGNRGDWRAVVRVVAFLLFVTGAGFVLHHVYQRYVLLRYIDEARLHYLHVQPLDDRPLLPRILHQQLPPALASWFLATPREIHFSPDAGDESDNSECMNWIDEYPLKSTVRRCSLGSALPRNHVIPMLRSLARWPRVEQVGFDGSSILKNFPRHNFAELDVVLTELEELGYPQLPLNPDEKLRREKLYARLAALQEPYP
ncbi:hypothetical protein Spb1_07120 [Planctopirus ephydatiae]|uniref:Uncharacterized protein n=1 Tax=Planctopirus ephydatiae TaxID=2528019 RepID=A0A518GJS5_9PLAN|nr:hypothetical protein [Planctopirus ephydatiae]QDV28846.1 hypothetical protein Spb1_07120 [Planctopirus ephydatiae]